MPTNATRSRTVARSLLLIVAVVVALIVFWPSRPAAGGQGWLELFFERAHRDGLPTWIGFGLVEWLSNLVMFLPLGFLGVYAVNPHRRPFVVPVLAICSAAVELVQLVLLPSRVSSVADVAANTAGAAIGWLIAMALVRRRER